MTRSQGISVAELSSTAGFIPALRQALQQDSHAKFIFVHQGGQSPSPQLLNELLVSFDDEKVLAVEPVGLTKGLLDRLPPHLRLTQVARLTVLPVMFRADLVRDYLETIADELGPLASLDEIGIYLNMLGYSCVSLFVEADLLNNLNTAITRSGKWRDWDAHVDHVTMDWSRFHQNPVAALKNVLLENSQPALLIDASGLDARHNGTSRVVVAILEAVNRFIKNDRADLTVTVLVSEKCIDFFELKKFNFTFESDVAHLVSRFHVGFAVTPISRVSRLTHLNRVALRWSVLHLDLISTRALQLLSQRTEARRAQKMYLENADAVFAISQFAKDDAVHYFNLVNESKNLHVVPLGSPISIDAASRSSISIEIPSNYVLVLGNTYPHKQVLRATVALVNAGFDVVTLGLGRAVGGSHWDVPSDDIDDEELVGLMRNASVLVMPSRYEGFGLPIAEAAAVGKPIVVWETQVSREVSELVNTKSNTAFCSDFTALPRLVSELRSRNTSVEPQVDRSLAEACDEIVRVVSQLLTWNGDFENLNRRWEYFSELDAAAHDARFYLELDLARKNWRNRVPAPLRRILR